MSKLRHKFRTGSIRTRLILILIFTNTIIFAVFISFHYSIAKHDMSRKVAGLTEFIAGQLSENLKMALWYVDKEMVEDILNSVMYEKQIAAILVRDEYGIFCGKTRDDNWNVIKSADVISGTYCVRSKEIFLYNEKLADVKVFLTYKFMQEELHDSVMNMIISLVILNVSLFFTLYTGISRDIITPVCELTEKVKQFADAAQADMNMQKIPADKNRYGEIETLKRNFDYMQNVINRKIIQLRQAEDEMRNHRDHLEELVEERTDELSKAIEELYKEIVGHKHTEDELRKTLTELEQTVDMFKTEINERRRAEEKLRKNEKALRIAKEVADKANRTKSEFLASMSHEIRTPMNAILGMADLLWESSLTPEQKQYVSIFRDSGEFLLNLINDILDLSKIEAGQTELEQIGFSLRDVVEKTCEIMSVRAHEKNLELTCHIASGTPARLTGDPARLGQILINLTGNAVKFTHEGKIAIRVECAGDGTEDAGKLETADLLFSVEDTGIGIPQARQDKIFDSFTQADTSTTREYGGTGLGVTICKHLVEMMGGRIRIESIPGKGTTFYFTARFGIQQKPAETTEPAEESAVNSLKRFPGRPIRILLVEDNKNNQALFCFYLKETLHQTDIAENGEIGCEKYINGEYDIIFMDKEMPVMDGYEAVRKIRKWERENRVQPVPIIALTAHALKGKDKESFEAGCTGYMTKPFKKAQLLEILGKYGEERTPTCKSVGGLKRITHLKENL
ncbi:MAG: response regulator [Desulfobacterales bacterium]|nr:response regulator [Desulfobacterales bacterium]